MEATRCRAVDLLCGGARGHLRLAVSGRLHYFVFGNGTVLRLRRQSPRRRSPVSRLRSGISAVGARVLHVAANPRRIVSLVLRLVPGGGRRLRPHHRRRALRRGATVEPLCVAGARDLHGRGVGRRPDHSPTVRHLSGGPVAARGHRVQSPSIRGRRRLARPRDHDEGLSRALCTPAHSRGLAHSVTPRHRPSSDRVRGDVRRRRFTVARRRTKKPWRVRRLPCAPRHSPGQHVWIDRAGASQCADHASRRRPRIRIVGSRRRDSGRACASVHRHPARDGVLVLSRHLSSTPPGAA